MRNKTQDSLVKVEELIKNQASHLYYDKKADLGVLIKEKQKMDHDDMERMLKKTLIKESQMERQQKEINRICSQYGVKLNKTALPYKEKIRQICQDSTVFYTYKKDRREMMDQSILKHPEYLRSKREEFFEMKTLLTAQYLGVDKLSKQELELFRQIQLQMHLEETENQDELDDEGKPKKKQRLTANKYLQSVKLPNFKDTTVTHSNGGILRASQEQPINQQNSQDSESDENEEANSQDSQSLKNQDEDQEDISNQLDIDEDIIEKHREMIRQKKMSGYKNVKNFIEKRKLQQEKELTLPTITQRDQEKTFISLMKKSGDLLSIPEEQEDKEINVHQSLNNLSRNINLQPLTLNNNSELSQTVSNFNQPIMNSNKSQAIINKFGQKKLLKTKKDNLKLEIFDNDVLNNQLDRSIIESTKGSQNMGGYIPRVSPQSILKSMMYQSYITPSYQSLVQRNKERRLQSLNNSFVDYKADQGNHSFQTIQQPQTTSHKKSQSINLPRFNRNQRLQSLNLENHSYKVQCQTPKMHDFKMRDLTSRYPNTIKKSLNEHQKAIEERESQKRKLQTIIKIIDRAENQRQGQNQKILADMLVQNLKDDEFLKTLDKLKEIDFADSTVLETLYEYKVKDEQDQIEQANEVMKEFHSGKLDPLNAMKLERKKKISQLKRN
eukprot:403371682